jgi:hypothetical protein
MFTAWLPHVSYKVLHAIKISYLLCAFRIVISSLCLSLSLSVVRPTGRVNDFRSVGFCSGVLLVLGDGFWVHGCDHDLSSWHLGSLWAFSMKYSVVG